MSAGTTGQQFGRYEVRGIIGRGGFATVYRAWDPALDREVAVKALMRDLAEDHEIHARFLAEARALARFDHPNIVRIQDVGEANGQPFFVMPLIAGPTLAELMAGRQPMELARALGIMRDLCSAVDYLHSAGLVHRDISRPPTSCWTPLGVRC
jgi:eukaryotic-like serine/threonine-protein kinase